MSAYGVVITSCYEPDYVGSFYWNGLDSIYVFSSLEEARKNSTPTSGTTYAPVAITTKLCRMLRKNPQAKYLGPVIE